MDDKAWLDSWMPKRLPGTFSAALRYARHQENKPKVLPYADSMYIMRHGKKAWRIWVAEGRPATPPNPTG